MTGHMTPLDWFIEAVIVACFALWGLYELGRWARRRITRAVTDAFAKPVDVSCRCDECAFLRIVVAERLIEMGEAA